MAYRTARRIHVLLMSWLTLLFLTAWLPLVRGAMDGSSYEWGGGQDANDVVGVLLTLLGWFLLSAGLGLWRLPRHQQLATAAT